MGDLKTLTVTVTPVITVDETTAYTLLGLLELYCKANKKSIEISHMRPVDSDEDYSISLDFIDDTEI